MEVIGAGLFDESNDENVAYQDHKENTEKNFYEWNFLQLIPEKFKLDALVGCFTKLMAAVRGYGSLDVVEISKQLRLTNHILKDLDSCGNLNNILLPSVLWPPEFQPKIGNAIKLCQHFLNDLCVPLISCSESQKVFLRDVLLLSDFLVPFCSETEQKLFIQVLVDTLKTEMEVGKKFLCVECLSCVLSRLNGDFSERMADYLFGEIKSTLCLAEDPIVGNILTLLLPKIAERSNDKGRLLQNLWTVIETCSSGMLEDVSSPRRAFMILCGLVDVFFPSSGCHPFVLELLGSSSFWIQFQLGFLHPDQLTRKRVLYIFRRILEATSEVSESGYVTFPENSFFELGYSCKENLANIWLEFLLLIETLEEKQIHVVQPVLDRFHILLQAATKNSSDARLLHFSWILLLFRRMAGHESVVIRRWSLLTLLKVDCSNFSTDNRNLEFLFGPFLEMLSDSSIYYRSHNHSQSEISIEQLLISFLSSIHQHIDENKRQFFWTSFFENLATRFWNGGVLVYVSRALAELPKCPVLGTQSISHFRKLLTLTVLAHDSVFRSAIQCFLTRTFFNLVNLLEVGSEALLMILGSLKAADTLRRGNQLWLFLVEWLKSRGSSWQAGDLLPKLQGSIVAWLQTTTNLEDNKDDLLNIPECLAAVRLLLLTLDAGISASTDKDANQSKQPALYEYLSEVLDTIVSINTRAYLSEAKIYQAFLFLLTLLKELDSQNNQMSNDEVNLMVSKLASELAETVITFVVRKLTSVSQVCDYSPIPLSLALVTRLAKRTGHQVLTDSSALQKLLQNYFRVLSDCTKNVTVCACVSLEVIGVICLLIPSSACNLCLGCSSLSTAMKRLFGSWTLKTEIYFPHVDDSWQKHDSLSLHILRSNMLSSQWIALSWYFRLAGEFPLDSLEKFIAMAKETLDVATPDTLVLCMEALDYILPKIADDKAAELLQAFWDKVKDLSRKGSFWSVYDSFLALAFQKEFMQRRPDKETSNFLCVCFDDILDKSEEKSGMLNLLVHRICHQAKTQHDGIVGLTNLVPCIAKALAFGPVYDKAKRLHFEVEHYLHILNCYFSEEDLRVRVNRQDAFVRVELLSFLTHLDPLSVVHSSFGQRLAQELMTNLLEILDSQHRSYANCMAHRKKYRLLVALMILEPYVQADHRHYAEFVLKLISKESQPSVRFLGEWMFIRLIQRQPEAIALLWNALKESSEKKPAVVCSFLVIVVHVAELIISKDNTQTEFLEKTLANVLVFSMSSNFNIRAFAQAALIRLWTRANNVVNLKMVESECRIMETVHSYVSSNRDSFWAAFQLLDGHYCFNFHPETDFSIETLVLTIPRLSGMTDEEWLSPDSFSSMDRTWAVHSQHSIPLTSKSTALQKCVSGGWKTKPTELSSGDGSYIVPCSGNVQKKMVPWQSLIVTPNEDVELSPLSASQKASQAADGLVLVTSLIDRIPNLGGLCRTCEIFGVSKFVIGSKRYLEDKAFEILSVTSHKWVNIEEVLPSNLTKFLLEAKKAGYTLVGAEQTARSQCLSKYLFPKKTLLLLGNERCGIPVEILQVLDVCIEIPQSGVIRSLNVHVTGALLIWEYYKQWNLSTGA